MKRGALVVALVVALTTVAGPSFGQRRHALRLPYEREQVRTLPSPFVLPDSSHPSLDAGVDTLVGHLVPDVPRPDDAVVSQTRIFAEGSVLPCRLFLGLLYPFAMGMPPDGGLAPGGEEGRGAGVRTMPGNVEGHVRVVFPLPTSLEIGFMLAAVAPTATFERDHASRSAALAASSLDPTNMVYFLPGRVTLRPAADLRVVRGPLVVQVRHGIDVMIDGAGIDTVKLAGRLLGHVGYRVSPSVELSLEASQLYLLSSDEKVDVPADASAGTKAEAAFADCYRVTDGRCSFISVGPGVRWAAGDVDVGASLVTNLGEPLSPAAVGFLGLRLSVVGHLW